MIKLPEGFTDMVMGKIETQIAARAAAKARKHNVWMIILYSFIGAAAMTGVIYALSAFEVISISETFDTFDNMFGNMLGQNAEIISTSGSFFSGIGSSFTNLFHILGANHLLVCIGFSVLVLYVLSAIIFNRKSRPTQIA